MKKRLDLYLVEKSYFETRNKAKLAIENGDIEVNGKIVNKVSFPVDDNDEVKVVKETLHYVSRGGLKLEKALDVFSMDVKDKICLDIGASTGGFTDCLIKHGASRVYAVDVGSNQLVDSLKYNSKVVSLENTNFRNIDVKEFAKYNISFACADVSFISLSYLFENVSKILEKRGYFIGLIKPQFETQKHEHNKNGLVLDKKIHFRVINELMTSANYYGLHLSSLDFSPIKGEKSGNIEYLGLFTFNGKNVSLLDVNKTIDQAFNELR